MATQTAGHFPLATEVSTPGNDFEHDDGSSAGASGTSNGISISKGALIAIIVVVVVVAIAGITSSVLFFVAKKREWTIKETIRRSARKVVTALTPRRSEFPRSVKESRGGRVKLDEVPPTPRIPQHIDLEKGLAAKAKKKKTNFIQK